MGDEKRKACMSSFAGIIQIKFNRIFSERQAAQLQTLSRLEGTTDRRYPPDCDCSCNAIVKHRSPCRQIYLWYLDLEANPRYSVSWSPSSGNLKMQKVEEWERILDRKDQGVSWIGLIALCDADVESASQN